MKNIKKYLNMIITAVICFAMSLVPGKKANARVFRLLADGQAVSRNTNRKAGNRTTENVFMMNSSNEFAFRSNGTVVNKSNSPRFYLKKVFFWMQGPGDKEAGGASSELRSPHAPPGPSPVGHAGLLVRWGEG